MKIRLKKSTGMGIKIAIIDSGINLSHPLIKQCNISNKSIAISKKNNELSYNHNLNDAFGHGTAVCGILAKLVPDAEFIIIKIFDNAALRADESRLIFALEYIIENVECDIIHMSLGTVIPSENLKSLCKKIHSDGILMVSAYDNAGAVSYPANYSEVFGVGADNRCIKSDDFMLIGGDNITILAKGGNHRLAWTEPEYIISQGSSFSAAYVTAYIAKMLALGVAKNKVADNFYSIAKKTVKITEQKKPNLTTIPFQIRNAVLFPYNKEMNSLVNYSDNLSFNISAICDSKYTGHVGQKICSIYGNNRYIISSINDVNWDEIDTLILGHTNEMDQTIEKHLKRDILDICFKRGINIYSFDDIEDYINDSPSTSATNMYVPKIDSIAYLKQYMGKLFQMSKPVIGVFGTSSQQGKFTLQLSMRYEFSNRGYSVAQIGTEPSALLFGMDACYPFGYGSTLNLTELESIMAINHLMHVVETHRPDSDLLIVGSQSGTVPMLYNNINQMTIHQLSVLMGILPDVVVLCINADDEIEYVKRTINAIESVGNTKVVALAIYPLIYSNGWQLMNNKKSVTTNIEQAVKFYSAETNRVTFIIGDKYSGKQLCDLIIEYLSED